MGQEKGLQERNQKHIPDGSPENQNENRNNDLDDLQIKTEIDAIGKRIDKIIETIEKIYPLSSPETT